MVPLVPTNLLGGTGQNTFSRHPETAGGLLAGDHHDRPRPRVEEALRDVDGVKDVQMTAGTPAAGSPPSWPGGADTASFTVMTDADADQEAIQDAAARRSTRWPRTRRAHVSAVRGRHGRILGRRRRRSAHRPPTLLTEATDATVEAMAGIAGATDVSDNLSAARPQVSIEVDRAKAARGRALRGSRSAHSPPARSPRSRPGTVRLDYHRLPGARSATEPT